MPLGDMKTMLSPGGRFSRMIGQTAVPVPDWFTLRAEIGRSLGLLRGTHLRVWLLALPIEPTAIAAAATRLATLGPVGRLPDGRLGLFYFGPLPQDGAGKISVVALVCQRLRPVVAELVHAPAHAAAVTAWADELSDPGALLQMLTPDDMAAEAPEREAA